MNNQTFPPEPQALFEADASVLLASIEAAALDALIVVEPRTERVVWASRSASRLVCGSEEALTGREVAALLPIPSEAARLSRMIAAVASARRIVAEFTGRTEDGALQPLLFSIASATVGTAELVHLVVRNISQQRAIEHALRRDQERLLQAQRIAGLGFWVNDVLTGQLSWSDQIYEIFGLTHAQFDGSVETFYSCVHPDDLASVQEAVAKAVAGEKPYVVEHRIVRPDGSQRVVLERGEVLFDDYGRAVQLLGTVHDITDQKRAELELRRSREQLIDAQRISKVGNFFWDVESSSFEWSEELYRLYGLDPSTPATVGSLASILHPEERDLVRDRVGSALEGPDRRMEFDARVVTPAGEARVLRVVAEIRRSDSGRPLRVLGTVQDITERAAYERSLQQLSRAVEQSADHVLITDRGGRIEYVNPSFTEQTGYSLEEIVGQNPRVLRSEVHPPVFYERLWSTIVAGDVFRGVIVNRKKNGELFYEEKTITPIRNGSGEITHFVSNGRDISERIVAEKEQARLQAEIARAADAWRRTFDAIDFPIVVVDRHRFIRRANVAALELSRRSFEELIGARLDVLADVEPFRSAAKAAVEVFAKCDEPLPIQSLDGTKRHWEIAATHFDDPENLDPLAIICMRDVTRLVELQESLRRSELMSVLGSIVAGVAHEVRNPLFSISATLDAFDAKFGSETGFQKYVTRLRNEVDRMSALMKELLEYGRPPEVQLSAQKVGSAIDQAISAIEALATSASVTVERKCQAAQTHVMMDSGRIAQVFLNLLENSIHYTEPGRSVTIGCRRATRSGRRVVECYVADRGAGFAPGEVDSVFAPFYTRRRGGTGLGLSIVQRIIEQHQGEIWASNREGGGAIVTFTLPEVRDEGVK